jgi:hypothetical protein
VRGTLSGTEREQYVSRLHGFINRPFDYLDVYAFDTRAVAVAVDGVLMAAFDAAVAVTNRTKEYIVNHGSVTHKTALADQCACGCVITVSF